MRKIAKIEKQVWKVYEILKKEGLGVEDSHLLLLFLSLYKDDQLEQFLDQLDELNNNQTEGELTFGYNNRKMSYQPVRYCYKVSMQLFKIKMLLKEQDKLVYCAAAKQFNELSLLKHTLGTQRKNFQHGPKTLSTF